jgi:hypothetical protein
MGFDRMGLRYVFFYHSFHPGVFRKMTKPDFNQWVKNMGITYTPGDNATDTLFVLYEGLYDLILDLQRQVKELS